MNMLKLTCAAIRVETETINWEIFAAHRRLYDIAITAQIGTVFPSNSAITEILNSNGKVVKALTIFPKAKVPTCRIEFVPESDIINPMPQHVYQNHLIK